MSLSLTDHIFDVIDHFPRRKPTDRIRIDTAKVSDTISIPVYPLLEWGYLILIGMLSIDSNSKDILHHVKNASAGMKQEWFSRLMYQIDDLFI